MVRWIALAFCFLLPHAEASFPPRVNVVLREKMSCREIKKIFKRDRLHIHCDSRSGMLQSFNADYFGKRNSLQKVLREMRSEARVDKVSPES